MLVSVVVPTYRRPELLDRCLAALTQQDLDSSSYEILVCDDAASTQTEQQVRQWATRTGRLLDYIPVRGSHGPAAARNLGWRRARGTIIAFTDDDCLPDRRWLTEGLAAFGENTVAVAGRVLVPRPDPPTDYQSDMAGLEAAEFVTANCLVRRDALERIGGFDERFACAWREDSDLHFTLLRQGGEIVRACGAVVVHPVRSAAWGVSLRQQRKSQYNALLYKKHPRLYRQRIRRWPPWSYYAIVFSLALILFATVHGDRSTFDAGLACWAFLTGLFCLRRLQRTSLAPGHIAEILVTSALIPPLSVFWRLYGACKFRVLFF